MPKAKRPKAKSKILTSNSFAALENNDTPSTNNSSNTKQKIYPVTCKITAENTFKKLYLILNHYNIDILLLNETLLKNKHKFNVPGYRVYRNDSNRGTALLIKNGIKNYEIQINNLESLETTAVNIKANGETLSIISVYNSPSNKFNKNDLDKIFNTSKVFAAGDFNSKNRAWGSQVNNPHDKKLLDYSLKSGVEITVSNTLTHFPYCTKGQPKKNGVN